MEIVFCDDNQKQGRHLILLLKRKNNNQKFNNMKLRKINKDGTNSLVKIEKTIKGIINLKRKNKIAQYEIDETKRVIIELVKSEFSCLIMLFICFNV